jgi:hypothetical protein
MRATANIDRQFRIWVIAAMAVLAGSIGHGQGPGATPATTEPAQRQGWWIRINPPNTATHVFWRFGDRANRLGAPVAWIEGQSPAVGIDLPLAQRELERVYVAALGMPPRAQVSFCLFFRDRGIKLVEFTQELNFDVTQTQSAPECVP